MAGFFVRHLAPIQATVHTEARHPIRVKRLECLDKKKAPLAAGPSIVNA